MLLESISNDIAELEYLLHYANLGLDERLELEIVLDMLWDERADMVYKIEPFH